MDEANYLLPEVKGLSKGSVGPLQPVLIPCDLAQPFVILDCFDQSLRRSRRLLIEVGRSLDLLLPDGETLSQPTEREYFLSRLSDGPVKSALADLSPLRRLLPVASGELRQGELALIDDEGKTRARAILRQISTAGADDVLIASLRGLRGYDKSLKALRQHLVACGAKPLQPTAVYQHLMPGFAPYSAKPDVAITNSTRAFDAANDIIAAHIPVMRANENGIIRDLDTEFLHDYRIALRKIRSVLSLFKGVYTEEQTAELKARFSALMTPTGPLRDLDVYSLERELFYGMVPDSLHDGLDRMFALFTTTHAAQQASLAAWLKSDGYNKEIKSLTRLFRKRKKLIPGPAAQDKALNLACQLIWKRYLKICRIGATIGPDTDDAQVHELRIHCKKLRYLMEFFGPLFPAEPFADLLKPLKKLQDTLGLFNDYSVHQISLQGFVAQLDDTPGAKQLDIAQSVGALILALHRRQVEERAKVTDGFARFNSPRTKQVFRDLFHQKKEAR